MNAAIPVTLEVIVITLAVSIFVSLLARRHVLTRPRHHWTGDPP